jgi:hypothetical protein
MYDKSGPNGGGRSHESPRRLPLEGTPHLLPPGTLQRLVKNSLLSSGDHFVCVLHAALHTASVSTTLNIFCSVYGLESNFSKGLQNGSRSKTDRPQVTTLSSDAMHWLSGSLVHF